MNEAPHYLEILALGFSLSGLTILSLTMILGYRFNRRVRATRRIDPREKRLLAWQTILGMFVFGICAALTGLSLSLWSPAGLARLTPYEVLFSLLFCGGSSALGGVALYLYTIWRWKFLLKYFYEQGLDGSWRDKPDIESNAFAQE